MTPAEASARDHVRRLRFRRAERVLRHIRQRIFDYESPEKAEKAKKVMATCHRILAPEWRAEQAAAEDRKLQRTPSAFEPGCR